MTISIDLGEEVSGVTHLEEASKGTAFKHELRTEVHTRFRTYSAHRENRNPLTRTEH